MVNLRLDIPEDFYKEEVRSGYTVTEDMKKVWAVELDLCAELDRVCRKYDIKYCADSGTLLGAIRHRGFIPWDDDMDLGMLRSEYKRLEAIAPYEFNYPYYWQTEETDPGTARGHAQLRNSLTTGILRTDYDNRRNNNFNQGIFIDIFPFDNLPDNKKEINTTRKRCSTLCRKYHDVLDNSLYYYNCVIEDEKGRKHYGIKRKIKHWFYKNFGISYKKYYDELVTVCQSYDDIEDNTFVADLFFGVAGGFRYKEDFSELVETDFEFIKIPVFRNAGRNLEIIYGSDYMIPRIEDNIHGKVIFDTDRPYTYYLGMRN